MGMRTFVVEQEDENFIVGVDWKNDDFLALEVDTHLAYSTHQSATAEQR